jgi:hypothetical protein
MTITHALAFDAGQLPAIERETESNLNLFDPATLFTLQPTENWLFCDDHDVVLYYHPNPALLLFHVLCVARLHPYGTSTPFQQRFLHGELLELPLAKQHRAAQYLHPDVLESWFPHLALLSWKHFLRPPPSPSSAYVWSSARIMKPISASSASLTVPISPTPIHE